MRRWLVFNGFPGAHGDATPLLARLLREGIARLTGGPHWVVASSGACDRTCSESGKWPPRTCNALNLRVEFRRYSLFSSCSAPSSQFQTSIVTGVRVVYEQNLSVMGVASCRSTFLCLMLRVRLVPSRFSVRDWSLFDSRACRGFRSAKWPGPAQPGPAHAPPAPHTPPMLPSSSPSLICNSRAATSLSHLSLYLPWCPSFWRR
jgi:hypothetical protein